jgi:chemotaxis signal transduction protein
MSHASDQTKNATTGALSNRLGSLQQFQTRIAARIAQAQSQTQQIESLLSIQVQGYRLLVPLAEINELLAMPEISRLPLSKAWVLGLTVVRSEVVTVFDLAHCLNQILPKPLHQKNVFDLQKHAELKMVLLSKHASNQVAFIANKIAGTVAPEQTGFSLAPGNDELMFEHKYIKQVWQDSQAERHIELSLSALIKSIQFQNFAH